MPIDMTEIEELERLLELWADDRDWEVEGDDRPDMEYNNHVVIAGTPGYRVCFMAHGGARAQDRFDAAAKLIAASKNALPRLLEEIKRGREALELSAKRFDALIPVLLGVGKRLHAEGVRNAADEARAALEGKDNGV